MFFPYAYIIIATVKQSDLGCSQYISKPLFFFNLWTIYTAVVCWRLAFIVFTLLLLKALLQVKHIAITGTQNKMIAQRFLAECQLISFHGVSDLCYQSAWLISLRHVWLLSSCGSLGFPIVDVNVYFIFSNFQMLWNVYRNSFLSFSIKMNCWSHDVFLMPSLYKHHFSHLFMKNHIPINCLSLCTDKNLGKVVWPRSRWPDISGQEGEGVLRVSLGVSQKGQSSGLQLRKGRDRDHKKCDTRGLYNTLAAVRTHQVNQSLLHLTEPQG